jgi:hypothetical protein
MGHVVCMGERRKAYRVLRYKREVKKPLGRSRFRWKYNIKINLMEEHRLDLSGSRQWLEVVNAAVYLHFLQNVRNF